MTLLEAMRTRLLAQAALTALVGERVSTLRLPENPKLPAVRLQEIDRITLMHFRGNVNLYVARVQIDAVEAEAHGDAYGTAHAVADAVRGGFVAGVATGLMGLKGTLSGLDVRGILAADQRERYESEVRLVKVETDYFVWFRQ